LRGAVQQCAHGLTGDTHTQVESETSPTFLADLYAKAAIEAKPLAFCYDRLSSLMKALEIVETDDFSPIQLVADFATLVGTYARGFGIIIEPFDERTPAVRDPVLQLACLDASLAIAPVLQRFQSVVRPNHTHLSASAWSSQMMQASARSS
jgi:DNA excision repair protein ERCC-2